MRAHRLIAAAVLGLALAAPACAQSRDRLAELEERLQALDPQRRLGEADAARLFAWLRASLAAAAQGRDVPPPPGDLRQRAEALSRELALLGADAARALLDALEEQVRSTLRERAAPAPHGAI
jgi:hypothetical protein